MEILLTGQTQTYDQGTGSSLFASTHASDTGNDHVLIYKLTSPYVVTMMPPIIDIAFGTKDSIQANDVGSFMYVRCIRTNCNNFNSIIILKDLEVCFLFLEL